MEHPFILSSSVWIGEGKITFSASDEHIRYYTKWILQKDPEGATSARQTVEMEGGTEPVINEFTIKQATDGHFTIELKNEVFGNLTGKGITDAKTVAWEFRGHPQFEGFEVYELQEDGDYMLHAEYASPDFFRTVIDGRLWKKAAD